MYQRYALPLHLFNEDWVKLVSWRYLCACFMIILLIDNNDSFTYNLLHLIKSACTKEDSVEVCLTDRLTVDMAGDFDRIIISPGPGIPSEYKILNSIIRTYENIIPILGICLGHQVIAESYGAVLYNLPKPIHGAQSEIIITDHTHLFRGINPKIMAGRYHSWEVSRQNLSECLTVTAVDDQGSVMSLSHKEYDIHGVQFHPESFMTDCGRAIVSNFIEGRQI